MKQICSYSILIYFILTLLFACAPSEKHFLQDESYREKVQEQFLKRKELATKRSQQLFSIFDDPSLTLEEKEALEFLYAYMPLSDLADYDGEYFLGQVRAAFEARDYFDWGKEIPDDVFRHFVLVSRVNNENLDTARQVFFDELKDRVKGLTMEQAVLEVNHWCHEKVTYRGTDGRTSSPLALMKTSWGRCGEESTFTTAALRAVGIPARQCYTPRWVHTDDNHAWVEAWVNGEWHYIGACEPEPELDVAWFSAPVKRAMMVHTNVFGLYDGPEEKNVETELYSVINLLENYVDADNLRKVEVRVVDENTGDVVEGAEVKFMVYNYAEFYPISTSISSKEGKASVTTGLGDVIVWANKGSAYGYVKSVAGDTSIDVVISDKGVQQPVENLTMNVPSEKPVKELSSEKIAENAKRLAYEDSIRNAYMSTFIAEDKAREFAKENELNEDKTWNILNKSQGNWQSIVNFMSANKSNGYLFPFLESLSDKDLRDTTSDDLMNHMSAAKAIGSDQTDNLYKEYAEFVLSPRIGLELIRPWRIFLREKLPQDFVLKSREDINTVINYINETIVLDNEQNYYKCPVSPRGVYELGIADSKSRDAYFVALCRSMDIMSRLDPVTGRPQYKEDDKSAWKDVFFEKQAEEQPKGELIIKGDDSNIVKPGYYTHYTISRLENGNFVTLNYEDEINKFPAKLSLDAGFYRLMIGSRANDGSISIETRYFDIKKGTSESVVISLPKVEKGIQVQGIVDPNTIVTLSDGNKKTLKDLTNKKGLFVCFSDPDKEPTKHILQDLPAHQQYLEEWGGGVIFVVPDDKVSAAFNASAFKGLPKQSIWLTDTNRVLLNTVANALQVEFSNNFPLVIYLSTNGGILYSSQGYRIGIGENIVKTIEEEKLTK